MFAYVEPPVGAIVELVMDREAPGSKRGGRAGGSDDPRGTTGEAEMGDDRGVRRTGPPPGFPKLPLSRPAAS